MTWKMGWTLLVLGGLTLSATGCDKLKKATGVSGGEATPDEAEVQPAEAPAIPPAAQEAPGIEEAPADPACPERFREIQGFKPGEAMEITCACDPALAGRGEVWGVKVFTTDSSICRAAVHAGVIQAVQGGTVTAKGMQGCKAYEGGEAHGVTSKTWQTFSGSFSFPSVGVTACPEPPVDEAMFINAYYETTCVQAKIADPSRQKEIIDEIHARYGFEAESFKAAQAKVGEQANVKLALESRMKDCTAEAAKSFAKVGAVAGQGQQAEGKEQGGDEVKKAKKPSRRFAVGTYAARGLSVADISKGEVMLSFTARNQVKGFFKGTREGKFFNIPLKGSVSKDGKFSARGRSGQNNVTASGSATTTSASGMLTGKVNARGFKMKFTAKK